jgi:hypothetical protein
MTAATASLFIPGITATFFKLGHMSWTRKVVVRSSLLCLETGSWILLLLPGRHTVRNTIPFLFQNPIFYFFLKDPVASYVFFCTLPHFLQKLVPESSP